MLFFENDYGYGAYPKVLEHLAQTNMEAGFRLPATINLPLRRLEKIKAAADCRTLRCIS